MNNIAHHLSTGFSRFPLVIGSGLVACILSLTGCSSGGTESGGTEPEGGKAVVVAPEQEGVVTFETLEPKRVVGSYEYRGEKVTFESIAHEQGFDVTIGLRGMALSVTRDLSGSFELDGYKVADGSETAMTAVDRALVHSLESAITETYRAKAAENPALDMFSRSLSLWSDYPDTLSLRRTVLARQERTSGENLCGRVNKPGQGAGYVPKYTWSSHDCFHLNGIFTTDCGPLTGGCAYGNDSSTFDHVFLSMHPGGSCSNGTYFGFTETSQLCWTPNHDSRAEWAHGNCFGRCGSGCGGSTQFSGACLDHDNCIRTGHSEADPGCADEVTEALVDYLALSNCGGEFHVDYNWAGSSSEGHCPTSWQFSNDGCDVGCQFVDGDCFR